MNNYRPWWYNGNISIRVRPEPCIVRELFINLPKFLLLGLTQLCINVDF